MNGKTYHYARYQNNTDKKLAEYSERVIDTISKMNSKTSLKKYIQYFILIDNVIRQYEDDRYKREDGYKFKCDFYIKSDDLFIEVNYWQGHGPHPFDKDNEDDLKLLVNWEDKRNSGLTQYDSMIKAWTIIDPMKLNIAKKNHLNYLMLYPNCKIKI